MLKRIIGWLSVAASVALAGCTQPTPPAPAKHDKPIFGAAASPSFQRMPTSTRTAITPGAGAGIYDTTLGQIFVGDSSSLGGKTPAISPATTPALAQFLSRANSSLGWKPNPSTVTPTVTLSAGYTNGAYQTNLTTAWQVYVAGATGGTYTLSWGGQTTSALAYNASAATVTTALSALSTVGTGNCFAINNGANCPQVWFYDPALPSGRALTANFAGLTGATSPSVTSIYSNYYGWLTSTAAPNPVFALSGGISGGYTPFGLGTSFPYSNGVSMIRATGTAVGAVVAEFYVDCTQFEIIDNGNGYSCRVVIDGVQQLYADISTSSPFAIPNDGNTRGICFDFGNNRAIRKVRVERSGPWYGIRLAGGSGTAYSSIDSVWPAPPSTGPKMVVIGDSYSEPTGTNSYWQGWVSVCAADLGWEPLPCALGGTGYLDPSSGGFLNFVDRCVPPANAARFQLGGAGGGTYTLSWGGQTTTAIAYNASYTTIQSALQALSSIGAGNITVTPYLYTPAGGATSSYYTVIPRNGISGTLTGTFTGLTGTVTSPTVIPFPGDVDNLVPKDAGGNPLPFYIVVAGGLNDSTNNSSSYTPAALTTAATSLWTGLQAKYPTATIIVVGPFCPNNNPGAVATVESTLSGLAANPLILRPVNNKTPYVTALNYFTGNGKTTALNGTGNTDRYINADGTHPNTAGHAYIGHRVARDIMAIIGGFLLFIDTAYTDDSVIKFPGPVDYEPRHVATERRAA